MKFTTTQIENRFYTIMEQKQQYVVWFKNKLTGVENMVKTPKGRLVVFEAYGSQEVTDAFQSKLGEVYQVVTMSANRVLGDVKNFVVQDFESTTKQPLPQNRVNDTGTGWNNRDWETFFRN